ncbi:MAG: ATP-binding cassette domain-containing protein [Caldilineaceae bacterium]
MIAVHLDAVSVTYIAKPVFTGLSWEIHDDRCVGLVGPNGAGKSTLLRLIAGQLTSDTGFTKRKAGMTVGYLPQEPNFTPGHTVWEEARAASDKLTAINAALDRCERSMGDPTYGDERAPAKAVDEHAAAASVRGSGRPSLRRARAFDPHRHGLRARDRLCAAHRCAQRRPEEVARTGQAAHPATRSAAPGRAGQPPDLDGKAFLG